MLKSSLDVFSDESEKIRYNIPDFPLYVRKGTILSFDQKKTACHWHPDLELVHILDGHMKYFVNGVSIHLPQGSGIFVSSKRLHYAYSENQRECIYHVVTVNPAVLGCESGTAKSFWENKFGIGSEDFIYLSPDISWQNDVLNKIDSLYYEIEKQSKNLITLGAITGEFCGIIADNIKEKNDKLDVSQQTIVLNMAAYIHQNYSDKISLEDIAAAGAVCRSKCCKLFSKFLGTTPNNYLNQYRVEQSKYLLKNTELPISDISELCGFQSPSYFTQMFQKINTLNPRLYRENHRIN